MISPLSCTANGQQANTSIPLSLVLILFAFSCVISSLWPQHGSIWLWQKLCVMGAFSVFLMLWFITTEIAHDFMLYLTQYTKDDLWQAPLLHCKQNGGLFYITRRCLRTLRLWRELRLSVLRKETARRDLDSERVLLGERLLQRSEEDKKNGNSDKKINGNRCQVTDSQK